jgi:atypical dual specificity phosphatase
MEHDKMMRAKLAQLLFFPSVAWNVLLCRVLAVRRWWSFIDEGVLLGAVPFEADVPGLVAEGVTGVINLCREYEGPRDAYERAGIRQLHLPTIDLTPPSLKDIRRGVAFIDEHRLCGETVYVHCKSGHNRSATLLLCWLMAAKGLAPREAQQWLQSRRPHVNRRLYQRRVVQKFFATPTPYIPPPDRPPVPERLVMELAEA